MARAAEWAEPLVRRLIRDSAGDDPREVIRAYADDLRRECDQDRLPIDVDLIRSFLGIRRREGEFDFAGRIYAEPSGQLVMDLRVQDSYERRRFTCAHELIHPAFPGFKREYRYRLDTQTGTHQRARSEEEWLCDFGAAELLMPRELVVGTYAAGGGLRDVERLARKADVSLEAAANRLVELSDEPIALIVLQLMHKPADQRAMRRGASVAPRLRVRYCATRQLDLFIPKFKSVEEDSVFARALAATRPLKSVEHLPGGHNKLFEIEAKDYSLAEFKRVLALARPIT